MGSEMCIRDRDKGILRCTTKLMEIAPTPGRKTQEQALYTVLPQRGGTRNYLEATLSRASIGFACVDYSSRHLCRTRRSHQKSLENILLRRKRRASVICNVPRHVGNVKAATKINASRTWIALPACITPENHIAGAITQASGREVIRRRGIVMLALEVFSVAGSNLQCVFFLRKGTQGALKNDRWILSTRILYLE